MVVKSLSQVERNVSASFGYVKKDILMVNDAISNLHDQIQHISMNQAMLLEKFVQLEKTLSGKNKKKANKVLSFYDVKAKESFKTSDYKIKRIKGRKFAIARSPSGNKSFRIMGGKVKAKKVVKKVKKTAKKAKKTVSRTPRKVIKETVLYN